MKINHLKRFFIGIAMTAFLALLAGNAFADLSELDRNPSRDWGSGTKQTNKTNFANKYMVVSPYWQVEGGGSYTFIAVTHSSLSGMASSIGVVVNAITSAGGAYDTAETFTVLAGETKRVFIIPTNHATINSTSVPDAYFLAGTTNYTYGHLRFNPATSHPMLDNFAAKGTGGRSVTNDGDGFRDSTMLSYWGSVIVEAQTTGFAMEFIGDVNDSNAYDFGHTSTFSNTDFMASGMNVQ